MMESNLIPRKKTQKGDFSLAIINVVFLLLFFFILTGTVVQQKEMAVAPPFTKKLPLERLPRPLITVSNIDELYLDGQPILLDVLLTKIAQSAEDKEEAFPALNVLADGALSAKSFLLVVDSLRTAGVPIRIVTVRTKDSQQAGQ